ncbi:MAG: ArsR family transcriptional regulator [Elusimicrobia bacterium]|nr:MAG: ArsR family transcriptional regulator [Elusimicrobiota bacterium]
MKEEALTPVVQKFIFHWGEMGTKWGVNRTVAQIHALMYLSPVAMNAMQIGQSLGIAQSNVSSSLKELQSWNLIWKVPMRGERRDYYETGKDFWKTLKIVAEQRKMREIDPTLTVLRDCMLELDSAKGTDAVAKERIGSLLEMVESFEQLFQSANELSPDTIRKGVKLAGSAKWLTKLLG